MEDLILQLDYRKKVSFAEQIQEQLRRLILDGKLRPNDQLPAVRQLAIQLKINFNTVARAYRSLDMEGLITTQQGRGTYVLERTPILDDALQIDRSQEASTDEQEITKQTQTSELQVHPAEENQAAHEDENVEEAEEVEQIVWIERWLNEAERSRIPLEKLHQAVSNRLKRQAQDPSHRIRPIHRIMKSSRKPLFQPTDISDLWVRPDALDRARARYRRKSSRGGK